ncbi:MBL fold metallo-hydrolase [Rhizobium skierniewicense]|uniref:MBL fold metallo-hydrolase n=1 Tax=Rhizobium skierniewicense TaxID=984260 RepID=UPI001FAD6D25|nr:MBL fold metallo-hydrolase [Rhizobium skierniewicense]MCI9868535.1 MBL fold metallo-hydrolase [Rhizobium skierniewicense]
MARPEIAGFYDSRTGSIQYVVACPSTRKCAIIDPVLDFDERSGSTQTTNANLLLDYVESQNLELEWILDTHPHADHFSAASYLRSRTGVPIAIGEHVSLVQEIWQEIYDCTDIVCDGSQWDRLFRDGESFKIGDLTARVMHSPGHTLASVTYVIGDAAFIHDTMFMPDSGSARADFPGGSAAALWQSIQNILSLPDETRLFVGHDYRPGGREAAWETSVAEQKTTNVHIVDQSREQFIRLREARDKTLPMPKLILQALQVNIRAGALPEVEQNGRRYLKIPLDAFPGSAWSS